eukprot:TRINITY_DN10366_c0_g2_i2.p1 TRINITY_DN10366_c0_g2~~TRINITY_DN10366_c0_g2_i2.p1  ORF type:complete len:431 (+),score=81.66 TRINITY_DN10366_c0_g2_i2:1962-3254(+)
MPKPGDLIEDRKNVMREYVESNMVLPLMFINSVGANSGYYYRFLPEFSDKLLNSAANTQPPPDLLGSAEAKFQALKFLKEPPAKYKAAANDSDENLAIRLWLNLWCRIFASHDIKEHKYRLTQLLDVLSQWQTKSIEQRIDVHSEIMKTCNELGSARLAIYFFDSIKSIEVRSHASVFNHYLAAISSGETAKPLHESLRSSRQHTFEEAKAIAKDSYLDYQTYFRCCRQPFQQRTFLTERMGNVISEEVKLGVLVEDCPQCNSPDQHMILDSTKVPLRLCSLCKTKLNTKLKIRVGRPIIYVPEHSLVWEGEVNVMGIKELEEAVESICEAREGFRVMELYAMRNVDAVFWNVIWYFTVNKLPYDLFLPYQITARKSLVIANSKISMKMGGKPLSNADKDGVWFEQFKQVRAFALCGDIGTQTDSPDSLA